MKEYITKNRAKQFVCGHCNEVCSEEPCEPSDCDWMAFIGKEPAADVVSKELYEQIKWERDAALAQLKDYGVSLGEKADVMKVRHGRWTIAEDDYYGLNIVKCSVCHEEWCFEERDDVFDLNYHYCPNCGAYMMGESNGKCE